MADLKISNYVKRFQNRAVDLGTWSPPIVRSKTEDGDTVLERAPSTAHCLMVNPQGHVVRVPLFNGMGKPSKGNPYYLQISREKLEKGFVPYGQCPKMHGLQSSLPRAAKEGAPCTLDATGQHPIDNGHPCKCVVAVVEHRTSGNVKRQDEINERYSSKESKQTDQMSKAIQALADVASKPTRTRRTQKDDEQG